VCHRRNRVSKGNLDDLLVVQERRNDRSAHAVICAVFRVTVGSCEVRNEATSPAVNSANPTFPPASVLSLTNGVTQCEYARATGPLRPRSPVRYWRYRANNTSTGDDGARTTAAGTTPWRRR
jgi:hypothetical protein